MTPASRMYPSTPALRPSCLGRSPSTRSPFGTRRNTRPQSSSGSNSPRAGTPEISCRTASCSRVAPTTLLDVGLLCGQVAREHSTDECDLLSRRDPQRAGQPELIDGSGDVFIAVAEFMKIATHSRSRGTPRDVLETRPTLCPDRRVGILARFLGVHGRAT